MIRCAKCHRPLTRTPVHGMGPTCARNAFGVKPASPQRRGAKPDERQAALFEVTP